MLRMESLIEPCVHNPFTHKLVLTYKDKLKIGVNCIVLLPIRVIFLLCILSLMTIISAFVTFGLTIDELQSKPLKGLRFNLRKTLKYFGYGLCFFLGFHRIRVNGKRATRDEARVFAVAPHSSAFDALALFFLDLPMVLSRVENANTPVVGSILKAMQPILVAREHSKKREDVIMDIKGRTGHDWPQLLIFPEGTCTNRECLISFKPGAFIPGIPVQPVVIQYKNKFDCMTWTWDSPSMMRLMFYTLCQFHNYMDITFLPVVIPNKEEVIDPRLYAQNTRKIMASYLNVPVTNHTFEDCRLMLLAKNRRLPFESGLIEFAKIKEKLGMNYENCQELLEQFADIARTSNGYLNYEEFCKYLEIPQSESMIHVFDLYDRDKNGSIDFREFLIGLSLISQPANQEYTIKFAFKLFDKENKSFVSLSDLRSILLSAFAMDPVQTEKLFNKIDTNNDGLVTYDEFETFARKKPEYAKIFTTYHELKILHNNLELERISDANKQSERSRNNECDVSMKKTI